MPGTLYLVATPIGNLSDISTRAIDTLKSVDVIACEDTRHTQKLLNHFGIHVKTISYHDHNEEERAKDLVKTLSNGGSVAVVSDAGTPGINDPGSSIIKEAIASGTRVVPIPGPTAFVSAVIASGLPTDTILFAGFLPSKKSDRRRRLKELRSIPATIAVFETPHRIAASLIDCLDVLGDRKAALARELTKLHEQFLRGTFSQLISLISSAKPRGEFVLIIDRERESDLVGIDKEKGSLPERVAQLEGEGLERRAALKKAAKEFGIPRAEAYRMLLTD